jgi:LPS O-antigen subunit length determinant protein (WzzB/FepE family)
MPTHATRHQPYYGYASHEADSLRITVRGVLRSLPIIILAAAVAVGGAIAYTRTRPETYRSTASLLFNDAAYQQAVAGGYNPVDAQRRLKTSADMIRLPAVAQHALRDASRQPGFHVRGTQVKTEYSLDSNTMRIVATGRDVRSPGLLANATAIAFLDYRREMGASALQEARAVLGRQIAGANTRNERRTLVAKRNNLDTLKALDDRSIQIAERAAVPAAATDDDTPRIALIAGVLGALVGVGISLLFVRAPAPPPPLPRDPWEEADARSDTA